MSRVSAVGEIDRSIPRDAQGPGGLQTSISAREIRRVLLQADAIQHVRSKGTLCRDPRMIEIAIPIPLEADPFHDTPRAMVGSGRKAHDLGQ